MKGIEHLGREPLATRNLPIFAERAQRKVVLGDGYAMAIFSTGR